MLQEDGSLNSPEKIRGNKHDSFIGIYLYIVDESGIMDRIPTLDLFLGF